MIFKKSVKKSLFLAVFFAFAAALSAQDFWFSPEEQNDQYEEPVETIRVFTIPEEIPVQEEEPQEETFEQQPAQQLEQLPELEPTKLEQQQDFQPIEQPFELPEPVAEEVTEQQSEPIAEEEAQPEPIAEQQPEEQPEETSEESEEKHTYEALALIRYKNSDTVSFRIKVAYIPKPYILAVSLSAGYTDYKLLQPFYFGAFLEPHVGIPQKEFPYKYEMNGSPISGPLIIGGKLYMPFGICVFPFQENIEFFVELAPGITLNMMWNSKFGNDTITSKLYPAFYGALKTGVAYRGFTFFIEGNYDAILGFGVSAGIGYSINFNMN